MTGKYCIQMYSIVAVVPKRRGTGYLKQAAGGHHSTPDYQKLMNAMRGSAKLFLINDLDGHLSFEFDCLTGDHEAEEVVKALKVTYTHVAEWEKLGSEEFFNLVESNYKK